MLVLLLWIILFFICWPVALFLLLLFPLFWLILLPFRLLGFAVGGVLDLVGALFLLPAKIVRAI